MKRLIVLVLVLVVASPPLLRAQLLLSQGESYAYAFSPVDLTYFGDGYTSPSPRGFATFYSDAAGSTPGATFTVDLFEGGVGESPIATSTGGGFVTAIANNGWQDLQGVARVTVNSGNVLFDLLEVSVYRPVPGSEYELYNTSVVPVPEPGPIALGMLGLMGLVGWKLTRRRC